VTLLPRTGLQHKTVTKERQGLSHPTTVFSFCLPLGCWDSVVSGNAIYFQLLLVSTGFWMSLYNPGGILTLLCLHAIHWKLSVMSVDSSVLFFFFIIIIVFILIFTIKHSSEPDKLVIFSGIASRCGKVLFCGLALFGIVCNKYGLTYGEVLENNVRYTKEINSVISFTLCQKTLILQHSYFT
jgi:hypothetical protein